MEQTDIRTRNYVKRAIQSFPFLTESMIQNKAKELSNKCDWVNSEDICFIVEAIELLIYEKGR